MKSTYDWHFPLPRTHTGMLLGNAITGAMVWGGDNVLNITLNRADHWDHRGGKPWTPEMNYKDIRRLLKEGDEKGLREVFEEQQRPAGIPRRPSILPLGRLELHFPKGTEITRGTLHLETGHIVIELRTRRGVRKVRLEMAAKKPVVHVRLPSDVKAEVRRVPAWRYVGDCLAKILFPTPVLFDSSKLSGWIQDRPADPPICLGYRQSGRSLWIGVGYGSDPLKAQAGVSRTIDTHAKKGIRSLRATNERWWKSYWKRTPKIDVPNDRFRFLYEYGMYKFAGLTAPHGIAAGLQGAWVEEYQMPPWSADYHFNINVQMCYWPAYQGNQLENLRPLLDLVWSWRAKLRENARLFLGIRDGYMLPHAVDDRATCMGGFWTGTLDHGCTAWVAKMMYDYWLYGGDKEYLRDVAYPFMKGTMRVYEAQLRKRGKKYVLPVSVSPEYGGAGMNAWGQNASFQLACIHWLIEALQNSSRVLKIKPNPDWARIQRGLPRACVGRGATGATDRRIMLWEGQDLDHSHRHHSHLAAIYPFDTIDPDDREWRNIATGSCRWWDQKGMGEWTGWCIPWASMLQTRIGITELTEAMLEYWDRLFTNEGQGTLHDTPMWAKAKVLVPGKKGKHHIETMASLQNRGEVMQIEAGMAVTAAIMDMLVHVRRGVHHFFPGLPPKWRNAEFKDIRTEGGFLVGGKLTDGRIESIKIKSTLGGTVRYRDPWSGKILARRVKRGTSAILKP